MLICQHTSNINRLRRLRGAVMSGTLTAFPSETDARMSSVAESEAGFSPSMLAELASPAEFVQLMLDPIYYGVGVPRGNGAPVLVLPGFLGDDMYLVPLRGWLRRIGYRAYESTLTRNIGCPNELGRRLTARTERIARETGRKVTIIGHSKGGM